MNSLFFSSESAFSIHCSHILLNCGEYKISEEYQKIIKEWNNKQREHVSQNGHGQWMKKMYKSR